MHKFNFFLFYFLGITTIIKKMAAANGDVTQTKHDECQYLELISKILNEGNGKGDRTGTGVRSIFGAQMRFSLRDDVFPMLTTKKVFFRGIAEELLWFIRGSTNVKELQVTKHNSFFAIYSNNPTN